MTSASKHPTAVTTDVAARIDTVADRIATGWGRHGHTALTTMIAELYTDLAVLPTHYTPPNNAPRSSPKPPTPPPANSPPCSTTTSTAKPTAHPSPTMAGPCTPTTATTPSPP